jgi:hypothetical protein
MSKPSKCAFAVIHFGSNPVYLELELYFFRMLRQYTTQDIIYLYSVTDTPESFVDAVRPMVTDAIPFDDRKITFDVDFASGYANFNTLRTCNFIFAYKLIQYDLVCIIESDMVIMKPIDDIFDLKAPAVLTYYNGNAMINSNYEIKINPTKALIKCKQRGRLNGGVMLIKPSKTLFETYKKKIVEVVKRSAIYPNETLFEHVNHVYYNMPIKYNFSHFLTKYDIRREYGLNPEDIYVFHFNETKFKHIDVIKNPIDESGKNWLQDMNVVKRTPIMHYKTSIYDRYNPEINPTMMGLQNRVLSSIDERSPMLSRIEESPPMMLSRIDESPPRMGSNSPPRMSMMPPRVSISPPRMSMMPPMMGSNSPPRMGSISHPRMGLNSPPRISTMSLAPPPCPKGMTKNKKTGECETQKKRSNCPKGTRRNKKTGECEKIDSKP